jgi:toxin HigB-1
MIQSFRCKHTEALFAELPVKRFRAIQQASFRKLVALSVAAKLDDLKAPPGNRLEALKGNRRGQHSVRINDQFRICFVWKNDGAHDVEITDYH